MMARECEQTPRIWSERMTHMADDISAVPAGLEQVGERLRLVPPNAPEHLRRPLAQLAEQHDREGYSGYEAGDTGYVLTKDGLAVGGMSFALIGDEWPNGWLLKWVWLHPDERRKGLLTEAWPVLLERHGTFVPDPPYTAGFSAFLQRLPADDPVRARVESIAGGQLLRPEPARP